MLNDDIYPKIAKFLPLADVKVVRSLNNEWNVSTWPELKRRCRIKLSYHRLPKFVKEMRHCDNFGSLKLELLFPTNLPSTRPYFEHCANLFRQIFALHSEVIVRHLELQLPVCRPMELELIYKILQTLSPNLESINVLFFVDWDQDEIFLGTFLEKLHFPKLSKYAERATIRGKKLTVFHVREFYVTLCRSAPKIQSIVFRNGKNCVSCLNQLEFDNDLLPKLDSLEVNYIIDRDLEFLTNLQRPLRKLVLGLSGLAEPEDYNLVQNLIKNNKFHLEFLELRGIWVELDAFNFQSCPKLKSLEIGVAASGVKFKFEHPKVETEFGEVNYSVNFPTLQLLSISSRFPSTTNWKATYDSFFPIKSRQVFENLQTLKLPWDACSHNYWRSERKKDLLDEDNDLEFGIENLQHMFPKASIYFGKQNNFTKLE